LDPEPPKDQVVPDESGECHNGRGHSGEKKAQQNTCRESWQRQTRVQAEERCGDSDAAAKPSRASESTKKLQNPLHHFCALTLELSGARSASA
jgi:hypothetical protein